MSDAAAEGTQWNGPYARAFLAALALSGNVTKACAAAEVGRVTVYRWRSENEAFATAWADAMERGLDALEDECMRRAMDGTQKFVVSMGKLVRDPDGAPMVEHIYSDRLAEMMLRSKRKDVFGNRSTVDLNVGDLAALIEEGRKRARGEG